jgi:hypothetical protein
MACSGSVSLVAFQPIVMPIFSLQRVIECMRKVEKLEVKDGIPSEKKNNKCFTTHEVAKEVGQIPNTLDGFYDNVWRFHY